MLESVLKLIAVPSARSNCGEGRPTSQKDAPRITLPTASTALILIDLQKGIGAHQLAPYSFEAVLAKGKELARRFRVAKAPVVLVNVAFAPDLSDALKARVDQPMQVPPGGFPEDWSELAD